MSAFDTTAVTVSVSRIELIALKKLSLVSHVLASKLDPSAAREQKTLVGVLDDLVRQIEVGGRFT